MSRPLSGYPTPLGSVLASVFPHNGPASYTQYSAPSTGGDVVNLISESGVKVADIVIGGVDTTGVYRAEAVHYEAATVNGVSLGGAQVRLKYYVIATGAEVAGAVNLSAITFNLMVFGQK